MATIKIRVLPDPAGVADAAAEHVLQLARGAVSATGVFSMALAGGNTPRLLYQKLAFEPLMNQMPWANVHVYFGDERCVPPTHPDSNFRMASETLLDLVPIPPGNIHRMRGEIEPQAAAIEYGQLLKQTFGDGGLDLAILGMGEDGHTASLFPGSPALDEMEHRCLGVYVEQVKAWRLTLSAAFLNRSKEILFLVTGASKAPTLHEVLEGERDSHRLPVQLVAPTDGRVVWLLDAAAAEMA